MVINFILDPQRHYWIPAHMGKTHSGGDTMRVVFEDENGKWLALMVWGSACKEKMQANPDMAFDLVMGKEA